MDSFPLVSVIIPCYNRKELIKQSLDSVYNQTYENIQLLVVDDGSNDGTLVTIEDWEANLQPRSGFSFKVLLQTNSGAQVARNNGLKESSGEFIQFLDSDDIIHPDKISLQVQAFLENPDLDFVHSEYRQFSENIENPIGDIKKGEYDLVKHISLVAPIQTSIGLYSKSICTSIGPWDTSLKIGQDIDYNARLIVNTQKIAFVKGCFTYLRAHDGERVSKNKDLSPLFYTYTKQVSFVEELGNKIIANDLRSWFEYAFATIAIRAAINKDELLFTKSLYRLGNYSSNYSGKTIVLKYILKKLPLVSRSNCAKLFLLIVGLRRKRIFKFYK